MIGKVGLVTLIIVIIGAAGYVLSVRSPTPTQKPTEVVTSQSANLPLVANARYVQYSKNSFEAAKGKKRILYFHADWCSTCRPLDRELQAMMDKIPQDVVIFKTNYDREISLKQIYAITYQHTFVQVDEQGNVVARWSGGNFNDVIGNIK